VCITGKLDRTRKEISAILEELGYEVGKSVTTKTYALITDGNEVSEKTAKAEKYGIKIVNYFDNKESVLAGII
jgi:NAD-dependent DNA ligase